ncbi:hypothetical protein JXA88_15695 [Candidatus Fermentibacteria bacterium]|nr:hypothetical protein [Candidatus Fermentibacteria bacterium]
MPRMLSMAMGVLAMPAIAGAQNPLIIDHTCTNLESIPLAVIEEIKSPDNVFHYGHRSHGWQPVEGLIQIESLYGATYNFDRRYCGMPNDTTALGMWDGMTSNDYVAPEDYWFSQAGMNDLRSILTNHPQIKYSMWSWCGEHHWWPLADIQAYLDSLDQLSTEFENVTFVYMTGNAEYDHEYPDPWGIHARWERGNMIRDYCVAHDKVLFDFEDMDCWYEGTQHTVTVELDSTYVIPCQHPAYWGDEVAHTTMVNCINKGKAFWYMMALLQDMLAAPVITGISADSDSIRVSWNPVSGASNYRVYSSSHPYSGYSLDVTGVFDGLTWSSEIASSMRFYHLTATAGSEESAASNRVGYSRY